ncbi:helix-turn-helix domain-containing protein [Comamonas sp. CMM03]|uniref:IclR family transcriptional regulator n=1 Tax=Comamonas sp. CMM03 TaxID=2854781 RepID=UPI001C47756E|nr:helix-turn-helix domain-containing protein [Comamonas sp. CMM03]MBV7418036.1 helix-turn-helix domain-containing protein [Comamonas sp. CMM03]
MAFPLLPMRPPTPSRDIGKLPMPIDDHKEDRQFVTALARGLQVLKCFTSGEEHLGNQEIAQRCRLPKSTVTRLTHTLTLLDFLHHDSVQNRYRLGMATLSLGGTTLLRLDAREISRPVMQELANQTGCLIALGMREGMSMLYLETARSDASVITIRLNLGSRIPLHTTAMGRAYLAGSRPAARRSVMERVKNLNPEGYADIERAITRAGEEYEATDCCTSYSEWRGEVGAIATPLRVGKGMPMMVLSASGDIRTMTPQFVEHTVRPLLLRSAWAIEQHFQPGN